MGLINKPAEQDEHMQTFLTLCSFERKASWKIDRDNLPPEALLPSGTIRLGVPVVMKLPVEGFPRDVVLPTGSPDDVFVGIVLTDQSSYYKDSISVAVGSGHFKMQTPQFDARDNFELKQHVFANSKGLLTRRPEGVIVGRVISLPTVEHPFLGVVGTTEG